MSLPPPPCQLQMSWSLFFRMIAIPDISRSGFHFPSIWDEARDADASLFRPRSASQGPGPKRQSRQRRMQRLSLAASPRRSSDLWRRAESPFFGQRQSRAFLARRPRRTTTVDGFVPHSFADDESSSITGVSLFYAHIAFQRPSASRRNTWLTQLCAGTRCAPGIHRKTPPWCNHPNWRGPARRLLLLAHGSRARCVLDVVA